jgi:hypothetical protein
MFQIYNLGVAKVLKHYVLLTNCNKYDIIENRNEVISTSYCETGAKNDWQCTFCTGRQRR